MMESSNFKRPVTLKGIALHAGVSHACVSAVLNGAKTPRVSETTRQRILASADELGYRPNLIARSMKNGKSKQIGVLARHGNWLSTTAISFLSFETIQGISDELENAGYMMNLIRVADLESNSQIQSNSLQGRILDGVIVLCDVQNVSAAQIEELSPHCIWADSSYWREENCVRRDEYHAGETMAREVAKQGYREWLILDSVPQYRGIHFSLEDREAAIRDVAAEYGANVSIACYDPVDVDFSELWPRLSPRVALLTKSFYDLHFLYLALAVSSMRAGHDFALACCDDGFHGAVKIGLTSHVTFRRSELGKTAAQMMLQRLENPEVPTPSINLRGEWRPGLTLPPCPA